MAFNVNYNLHVHSSQLVEPSGARHYTELCREKHQHSDNIEEYDREYYNSQLFIRFFLSETLS